MITKKTISEHDPYYLFASVNWCTSNKLKILYLEKTKFYSVIDKDLQLIESKIKKIIKKKSARTRSNLLDYIINLIVSLAEDNIALIKDLKIVEKKLHFTRKQFNNINKEIKNTWTKIYGVTSNFGHEIESDEERLANIIYDVDFGNSFFNFNNEIHFIQQNMKNTINYLSKFGCVTISIDGCDSLAAGSRHPWYKLRNIT